VNFGDCPYDGCDGFLTMPVPERTPAYSRTTCPKCKGAIWYVHSRVAPVAWRAADFEAAHDIDLTTKTITRKPVLAVGATKGE
jgi:hypothetical protein